MAILAPCSALLCLSLAGLPALAAAQGSCPRGTTGESHVVAKGETLSAIASAAGLRVAAVSNVSIVSVASLIGVNQLGYFLTNGYARNFATEVWVGIVACVALAVLFDVAINGIARVLTPWVRAGEEAAS